MSATGPLEIPFSFVAGDPSLELVNTVNWTPRGLEDEQLSTYERLTRWAEAVGVLAPGVAERLRQRAALDPGAGADAMEEARRVRGVLRRVFRSIPDPERGAALAEFNALLAQVSPRMVLDRDPSSPTCCMVTWREAEERLDSPLWPVVHAAQQLLVSQEAGLVRECGGIDCGWMYVDRSRNGLRRWCDMRVCGTRAKSRRRAARRRVARRGS